MKGYLYAIRRVDTREIKIGWSADPVQRLEMLQAAHARPLTIALILETDDVYAGERELHERFRALRLGGEWFEEGDEILEWLAQDHARRVEESVFRPVQVVAPTKPDVPLRDRVQCEFTAMTMHRRCEQLTRVQVRNAEGDIRFACGAHEWNPGWERVERDA